MNPCDQVGLPGAECGLHFDHTVADETYSFSHAASDHSTWLPAALLATLVLLASALQAFGGETQQLEWRPAFARPRQTAAGAQRAKPAVPPQAVRQAPQRRDLRRDYAVAQAAYNDTGSWSMQPQGAARMESLVVHPRDPQFAGTGPTMRVAQDPFEDTGMQNGQLDDELSRDINLPFGDSTAPEELPGIDAGELPDVAEPQLPDNVIEDMTDEKPADDLDQFRDEGLDERPGEEDLMDDFGGPSLDDTTTQPGRTGDETPGRFEPRIPRSPEQQISAKAKEKFETERQLAAKSCQEAMAEARTDRITNIELGIRVTGREGWDYPFECSIDDGQMYAGRQWPEVTYMWKAAANCHKPLYFEQAQLERYGHSWGPALQPIVSGAHFFTRLPVLPYCMGITPPNECIYPLGYYRPGNCAPYMIPAVPFTWRAALFEAGGVVGTAAVLP